jgi:hypothetical protein
VTVGASKLQLPLDYFLHGACFWLGQGTAVFGEIVDYVLHDLTEFGLQANGIVTMDARDQVGTFADIDLILFAPLNPLVVLIGSFHLLTISIARWICFLDNASRRHRWRHLLS